MIIKKKYKEILFIKSFKKESNIYCDNYESIKSSKIEKKNDSKYTFLQMNNFIINETNKKPTFNLFINSLEKLLKGTTIIITVFINIDRNRLILRNLEEVEAQAECKTDEEYDVGNAKLICETITDEDFSNAVGLNIDSDQISGIPENADPAKTDIEISQGIVPDYNNEKVFKTIIPTINDVSINGTMCHENGEFEIYGKSNDIVEKINNFDVSIYIPPVSSFCDIISNNDNNIKLKCFTKDKFSLQKVIIEKQMIQKNGTLLFILTGASSTEEFSCSINSNYIIESPINLNETNKDDETDESKSDSNEPGNNRNIRNKFFNSKTSSGLSGGAIAAIIIVCVVAVIAVVILINLIKSGKLLSLKNRTEISEMNNSSTMNAVAYNP